MSLQITELRSCLRTNQIYLSTFILCQSFNGEKHWRLRGDLLILSNLTTLTELRNCKVYSIVNIKVEKGKSVHVTGSGIP
jgi:hypothetical protein